MRVRLWASESGVMPAVAAPPPRRPGEVAEAVVHGGEHLVDPVTERVLGERAPAGVLADRARLVGMRQIEVELAPELAEVPVAHDLLTRLEEVLKILLEIHDLAGGGRRQLEGARVHADDIVHRMVVVE